MRLPHHRGSGVALSLLSTHEWQMKFWEAMKLLEEGKKVRQNHWFPHEYIDNWYTQDGEEWLICGSINIGREWELYEEPKPKLTFANVVKGLKEEKKFKRKHWDFHVFIGGQQPMCHWLNIDGRRCFLNAEDYEADDWEEVR